MTTPNRRSARIIITLLLLATCAMFLQVAPASATVAPTMEQSFLAKVNNARANKGLAPLKMKLDLRGLAREQCEDMASTNTLFHSSDLDATVRGTLRWGENVGYGYSVRSIHKMLMLSPGHRANILSSSYTHVGIGVERTPDGTIWVTQIFRQPL